MKDISGGLGLHIKQEVTTLARCWKIVRTDGTIFRFTAHDADLIVPDGFTPYVFGLGTSGTFTGTDQLLPIKLYSLANSNTPIDTGTAVTSLLKTLIKAILPADIDATWTKFAGVSELLYDPADHHVVFFVASADVGLAHLQYVVKINTTTGAVVWKTPYENSAGSTEILPGVPDYGAYQTKIDGSTLLFIDNHNNLYRLNTSTGGLSSVSYAADGLSAAYQTWDARSRKLIFHGTFTSAGMAATWGFYDDATQTFKKFNFDTSVIGFPADDNCAVDSSNGRVYFFTPGASTSTTTGLHVMDTTTGAEIMYDSWFNIHGGSGNGSSLNTGMHIGVDGKLWIWSDDANYAPWVRIEPSTLRQTGTIGVADTLLPDSPDPDGTYGATTLPHYVVPYGIVGSSFLFVAGAVFSALNILDITGLTGVSWDQYTDGAMRVCGSSDLTNEVYSSAAGFQNSAIENKSDLSVDNQDVQGVFDHDSITLEDLRAGAFDYADVYIFFMNWQDTSQGPLKMRRGKLGEVTASPQGWFSVELRGMTQLLQQQIVEMYGPECRADLFDSRCALDITQYQRPGHVTAITDATHVTIAFDATAPVYVDSDAWYKYGQLMFTSGANNLKALEIKSWSHTLLHVEFYVPAGYPIQVGDTFLIVPGCDKTQPTCKTVFNNVVNFRGEPFIPGNDAVFSYPAMGGS